jgi:hypothetical protein
MHISTLYTGTVAGSDFRNWAENNLQKPKSDESYERKKKTKAHTLMLWNLACIHQWKTSSPNNLPYMNLAYIHQWKTSSPNNLPYMNLAWPLGKKAIWSRLEKLRIEQTLGSGPCGHISSGYCRCYYIPYQCMCSSLSMWKKKPNLAQANH